MCLCTFWPWATRSFSIEREQASELAREREIWRQELNTQSSSSQYLQTPKIWEKKSSYKTPTKTKKNDEKDEVNRRDTLKINRYILYFCVVLEKNILYNRLFIAYKA